MLKLYMFYKGQVTAIWMHYMDSNKTGSRRSLDGNYTRMLRAILNKSWRQHPTRHQLYGHLPPITKTIQVRWTRHAGHCWRSWDELISDVLLWTPTHGRAKAGRPARTYIQQLCEDTGCCPEYLPGAMKDREEWRERVRDIRATSATWWWWWWFDRFFSHLFFTDEKIWGKVVCKEHCWEYILEFADLLWPLKMTHMVSNQWFPQSITPKCCKIFVLKHKAFDITIFHDTFIIKTES